MMMKSKIQCMTPLGKSSKPKKTTKKFGPKFYKNKSRANTTTEKTPIFSKWPKKLVNIRFKLSKK